MSDFFMGSGKYGDDLLLRPLSGSYHWRDTVSLSCSEWERVLPDHYDHQFEKLPDIAALLLTLRIYYPFF